MSRCVIVMNWSKMLCASFIARRPPTYKRHQGHSVWTSRSPCAKAPRSCDAGRVTAGCAVVVDGRISCPLAPHRCAVSYSLMLPLKGQRPTLNFQWISMWTCEDTRRESGNKSLNKRLLLIRVTGSVNQQPLGERQQYRLDRTPAPRGNIVFNQPEDPEPAR